MNMKFFVFIFIFNAKYVISDSEEKIYSFECANKFYPYHLDNEPVEHGISAGQYAPGKEAYIALSVFNKIAYQITRLQLEPPGVILYNAAGPGIFSNDSNSIWYLYNNPNHKYKWVNSSHGQIVPFAIDVGYDVNKFDLYIGRIRKNDIVMIGLVIPAAGVMFYADENGFGKSATEGYEVLTCSSSKYEEKIPTPSLPASSFPNIDSPSGCVNNWLPYNNDNAPMKNGISAGLYGCDNQAYVGKGKTLDIFFPGRIQTTSPSGLYVNKQAKDFLMTNGSYYLANNLNYTYDWIVFDGSIPSNAVFVRNDVGSFFMLIARLKINGKMKIGWVAPPLAAFADENGNNQFYSDYEILVCDPWPKYQCTQQWRKFDVNSGQLNDSFSIDGSNYIGRILYKGINTCNYGLGRLQTNSGLYYINEVTRASVFDNSTKVEYLVKNQKDFYKWQPSRNGEKVKNALKFQNNQIYIGMTRINDNTVVGKVHFGKGLSFINPETNLQQFTSSYNVLTCYSAEENEEEFQ
ncbi:hypothetical protein PVAND_003152 [Polypedilum vanderplanki]|uniref:Uncharacterized protein n=1 Tax=Polypedilum vanderplanki TaxID=319348 RepID=A0A9J6BU34_POLVA|nr:hypothetical protein PVAND_003152 [Polypedilum vanderplanki]